MSCVYSLCIFFVAVPPVTPVVIRHFHDKNSHFQPFPRRLHPGTDTHSKWLEPVPQLLLQTGQRNSLVQNIQVTTRRQSCDLDTKIPGLKSTWVQFLKGLVLLLVLSHESDVLPLVSRPRFKVAVLRPTDKVSVSSWGKGLSGVFQRLPEPTKPTAPRPLLSLYGIIYVIWYTSNLPEATEVRLRLPNSHALLGSGRRWKTPLLTRAFKTKTTLCGQRKNIFCRANKRMAVVSP